MAHERGFSVVELLIAVAIVGILAAIAVPSYDGMMARSKQSEAKGNLSSIHTLQVAYHGEQHRFGSFVQIGFVPEGETRYGYRIRAKGAKGLDFDGGGKDGGGGAGDDGDTGDTGDFVGPIVFNPTPLPDLGNPHFDADSFEVVATGSISASNLIDAWSIDEHRTLVHLNAGY